MNSAVEENIWTARQLPSEKRGNDWWSSFTPNATWRPLRQPWIPGGASESFQPGWARVGWTDTHLIYDVVFVGHTFRNAARQLNELTWELGDVCELFIEAVEAGYYIEVHITPENQRLQLRFPPNGIAEVRGGRRQLREFIVTTPDWVRTETNLEAQHLHIHAVIPAAAVGVARFTPKTALRTAVCRYDYAVPSLPPQLSSTAPLSAPAFHQREEWSRLRLSK